MPNQTLYPGQRREERAHDLHIPLYHSSHRPEKKDVAAVTRKFTSNNPPHVGREEVSGFTTTMRNATNKTWKKEDEVGCKYISINRFEFMLADQVQIEQIQFASSGM